MRSTAEHESQSTSRGGLCGCQGQQRLRHYRGRRHRCASQVGCAHVEISQRDSLAHAAALLTDAELNIYVADPLDHKIRRVSRRTNIVTTIAGSGQPGLVDGQGTRALLQQPTSLALWRETLIMADIGNNAIRTVRLKSAAVSVLAGSRDGSSGFADGSASTSRFQQPSAVCVHHNMLLVMEPVVHRIRCVSLLAGTTSTLYSRQTHARWAGLAYFFAAPRSRPPYWRPGSRAGNVFLSDSSGCLIRSLEVKAECDGLPFSHVQVDRCGTCGGNNSCVDCAGQPHGTSLAEPLISLITSPRKGRRPPMSSGNFTDDVA